MEILYLISIMGIPVIFIFQFLPVGGRSAGASVKPCLNPSNSKTTFVLSTRMQRF